MKLDREQDREVLRQAAMILEKENRRLVDENVALQRRVLALEGKSPEELQSRLAVLEEQLAVLRNQMFGPSSEKRPGPAQPHERAAQKGHGSREQPQLPIRDVIHVLDEADLTCPKCGGRLEDDGGGQPILFGPGGSYQYSRKEPRGGGGYFNGKEASLEKFVKWQKDGGDRPFVYKFDTTPEQEAQIASRFGYGPDPSKDEATDPGAGYCSATVSTAISGVGPFKNVKAGTTWPGNLEDDLKKAQKNAAMTKPADSAEKKKQ